MGVIFKHTLKNMFSKPFRTIMLVLCILICSFAGMMTFDMSNSVRNVLESAFLSMFGDSNVIVSANNGLAESDFEGLPAHDKTMFTGNRTTFNVPGNDKYAYFNEKSILIYSADIAAINEMDLVVADVDLAEDEVAIPKTLAEELDLSTGDTIEFFDEEEKAHAFTVKSILTYKGMLSEKYNVVMPLEGFSELFGEDFKFVGAYVRVHDRGDVGKFCTAMEENTQGLETEDLINGEMVQQNVNSVTSVFAILFLICLMLVIFVTISLSERIMVERMGTVGTLRSLGVSPNATALIVLFENALYGLIGGVLGSTLYVLTRDPIFNNVFSLNSGSDIELEMNLGNVSVIAWIGVIIGAVVIECLCPIKELLKATRTSIRDLIFDNKDTDYKYTKKTLATSILFAVLGIAGLVMVLTKTMEGLAIVFLTIVLLVAALFLGYPFILRRISKILEKHFIKKDCPVAAFACVQARTKKASVGISRLFVMAVAMGLVLFVLSTSYVNFCSRPEADADVVVTGLSEEGKAFEYFNDIEGVTEVEFMNYNWGTKFIIGDDDLKAAETANSKEMRDLYHTAILVGTEGDFKLFNAIKDLPETIGDDEIYMDKSIAKKLGYSVGDEIPMIMGANGEKALNKTMKLAGYCDSIKFAAGAAVYVVSLDNYNAIFEDHPTSAYLRCEDPKGVVDTIKERSGCMINSVLTMDDYMEEVKAQNAGMSTLLYMLIGMGVILTFVAVVSNQTIGFSGRRRECAVLVSTAMSRGKLKKAFFTESLISSIVALVVAIPFAAVVAGLFQKALEMIEMNFGLSIDLLPTMAFIFGLFVLFVSTVLMPIKHIRKMKIAEQLKYE
ncbi:MAG: ABC transporter permease [Clostridiales bacterium]|nr:ABC transporter permease [Clostridiales bacterium]